VPGWYAPPAGPVRQDERMSDSKSVTYVIVDIDDGHEVVVETLPEGTSLEVARERYWFHQDTKGGDHHLYKVTRKHLLG